MLRLTESRINKWRADLESARNILIRTRAESKSYYLESKGGRQQHLALLVKEVRNTIAMIDNEALPALEALATHESAKKAKR